MIVLFPRRPKIEANRYADTFLRLHDAGYTIRWAVTSKHQPILVADPPPVMSAREYSVVEQIFEFAKRE